MDNISNRVNIDDTKSGHYEEMIDFLLDSKFCVVNGRVTKEYDNYTCVSSRGSSVVDYMLVPHSTLEKCDSFKVHSVKDLIHPTINTVESLSDHSVLELCIKMGFTSDMITSDTDILVLGPDQNLVPIGVTKLYCDFQLDKYMRGLKMYDGLFKTVA